MAFVHYSTIALRKRLGKQGFAAYRANPTYLWLGRAATFVYFSITLFLFANSMSDMRAIAQALTHR